jgi:hypothetical protein
MTTRTMTDAEVAAISRTLASNKTRTAKLVALQSEHHLTESAARTALEVSDRSTPEGRRLYESAEVLVGQVVRAESDLSKASTTDLEAAIAARFA